MKKILLFFLVFSLFLFSFFGIAEGLFNNTNPQIHYCSGNDCGLDQGVETVRGKIDGVESQGKASEYIQSVVVYILTFLTLIAILLIIYSGFNILTSAGDEDKAKKSKTIIIYTIIGLVIIYLAGPITDFVINILTLNR